MPRDGELLDRLTTDPIPQDVQNLRKLADALERERDDFTWDFGVIQRQIDCGTAGCAVGLAMHVGLVSKSIFGGQGDGIKDKRLLDTFGLDETMSYNIFHPASAWGTYGVTSFCYVTPGMVAKELRRIADEKVARAISKRMAELETQDDK